MLDVDGMPMSAERSLWLKLVTAHIPLNVLGISNSKLYRALIAIYKRLLINEKIMLIREK